MLRGGGGGGTNTGFLSQMLTKVPQFSGEISTWSDFVSRFKKYLEMVQEVEFGGRVIPARIKEYLLMESMDADNRSILQAKYDKGLGFDELWGDLEKRYEVDTVEYYRKKLEGLEMPLGG